MLYRVQVNRKSIQLSRTGTNEFSSVMHTELITECVNERRIITCCRPNYIQAP